MKFPKKLNVGDTVGVVAGCSKISTERIALVKETLENMGYKVKMSDNLDKDYAGIMAGTGKERGEWINKMFADPEIDAIFCVRGGNGSSRAMEYIDTEIVKNNPKIFLGFSDVTNYHLLFNQKCDLVTFHGPMVSSNMVGDFDAESKEGLFRMINAEEGTVEYKNPEGYEIGVLKEGKASGVLVGGNLSLLSASMATPFEMDTEDKIIFIEEVCEPESKIEKWAYHLKNAGKFAKCKGVILGQFTDVTNENCPEYNELENFKDILSDLDIPVLYGIESGHGDKMMTLPFGAMCHIDTETKTIKFDVER